MLQDEKFLELRKLVSGKTGQRLPGERELTAELQVSRPRLRAMLDVLESEGLVQRRQGSGTYALSPDADALRRVVVLVDKTLKLGDDPFFSLAVETLQAQLQKSGAQCLLQRSDGDRPILPRCDAIVALGHSALLSLHLPGMEARPAVALFAPANYPAAPHISALGLDDRAAGGLAAQRLLDLGVKSVLFFGWPGVPAVRERMEGAAQVLAAAAVPLETRECGLNFGAGLQQSRELEPPPGPQTGLIAANDWLALGLRSGLRNHQIPIVSFDALPLTESPELNIQSLKVPLENIGADAVAELYRLSKNHTAGRTIRYAVSWREPMV